ncbi:Indole-3-glycerol phosphate synthase [Staphylococcus aureus]|uniref:Indole-3-glycerol phosphate synthase n=1 Tax=Staphylococcus aureus TaxID=1280 RepID=A0A2X2K236_STAAU|nr:Indole-3-glycerol phosphate synthase [Staphylococcus aureus]
MTILEEIVEYKQLLLQNGYYQDKLNTLKSVNIQNKKSFINAIEKEPKLAIIAEIKSKSPTVNDYLNEIYRNKSQIMSNMVQMLYPF